MGLVNIWLKNTLTIEKTIPPIKVVGIVVSVEIVLIAQIVGMQEIVISALNAVIQAI
jgi:hypothetical protein